MTIWKIGPHLVQLADERMYRAKKGGRARAVVCGEEVMTGELVLQQTKAR